MRVIEFQASGFKKITALKYSYERKLAFLITTLFRRFVDNYVHFIKMLVNRVSVAGVRTVTPLTIAVRTAGTSSRLGFHLLARSASADDLVRTSEDLLGALFGDCVGIKTNSLI